MAIFTPELLHKLKYGYYFWPILFVCATIVSFFNYFIELWQTRRCLMWIDGPPSVPILGNALSLLGKTKSEQLKITNEWLEKYDGLAQMWIFHRPTILISKKELVERLLKGIMDTLTVKSEHYKFLSHIIGEGILSLHAVEWKQRRKLISPFFHESNLEGFVPKISHHARTLVHQLKGHAKSSESIDIQHYTSLSSVQLNADVLMDSQQNNSNNQNMSFVDALKTITDIIIKRAQTPLLNWNLVYLFTLTRLLQSKTSSAINSFTSKVILKKKKDRETEKKDENNQNRNSLVEYLLEKQQGKENKDNIISDVYIQRELNHFVFSGSETLSSGIAFTLYLLGRHPHIQEKVYTEIRSTLPGLGSERDPSVDQLNKLDLLGKCIKESLRLYPPVPWIARKLRNTIKIGENKLLPEGVSVAVSIYKLHREEKYYSDANLFNPERFQHASIDESDDYSYIPFGTGWRNCIGQKFALLEMKIILSNILNEYSITSLDRPEDLKISGNVILRSDNGLKIKFCCRK